MPWKCPRADGLLLMGDVPVVQVLTEETVAVV